MPPAADKLRRDARRIWWAGVEAVRSDRLVRQTLRLDGSTLTIGEQTVPLEQVGRIAVVGAGKAGAGMAAAVEEVLGPQWIEAKAVTGWVNVPDDCVRGLSRIHLHGARPAGVNEPTPAGAAGAAEILRIVQALGPEDLCLALISGGGSALMPAPVEGVSLADKLAVTRHLSAAGANIEELNTVRKQLSRLKGGGLARACRAGRLAALIISDVLGDPLEIIASGPTVEDSSTPEAALAILDRYQAKAAGVPQAVFDYLAARCRDNRTRHAPRDADPHAEREEYLSPSLVEVLRCPACRGLLEWTVEGCRCAGEGCRSEFPRSGGVPLLIHEAQSVFSIAAFLNREPTFFKPVSPWRAWLSRRLPDLSHNLAARRVLGRMRDRLLQRSRRPRVLVIGAGEVGVGLETLLEEPAIEMVEVDASLGPRVQVVCDAHDLPLADGAFDGVVIQAVLEHVLDPVRCVAEIHRVLKPGGLVYADTPQVCQVHGREFDFTRYTRLGHRRLFRHFGELESGISSGPAMALGWTVRYFLLSISSRPLVRAAISGFSRLTLFWLKYLDYLLLAKPAAMDAAFAFYFLGEKRDEILHDRDLVRSYRGGF
jgi:SAM-dependent methyltransferase